MALAALLRGVAKKAATKAVRAKKAGDKAYNARRRYQRSAERNLKKAEQASGATAARYRQLARNDLDQALSTYEQGTTQKFNKEITRLAKELNVDIEEKRKQVQALSSDTAERMRQSAISDVRSKTRLVSSMEDAETRRQSEARQIINSPIGHRIVGGLEDIWKPRALKITEEGITIDKSKILPSIFDFFKVDNLGDLLDRIEDIIGERLYTDEDSDAIYQSVKMTLQKHALTRQVA